MWSWAMVALGTLPSDTLLKAFLSVTALTVFFALTLKLGQHGWGPLRHLLRMTSNNLAHVGCADLARERVTGTMEWILAVRGSGAS